MRRINAYGPSLIVLATTTVVLLAGPAAVKRITFAHTQAKIIEASQRLEQNAVLEQLNQAYRDIAAVVEPSVVHVSTEHIIEDRLGNRATKASSGSGWIFDGEGHVVTNEHVIENASDIEIQFYNGEIRKAEIVGSDPTTDIAVLRVLAERVQPAERRDTAEEPVRQGDIVFAFGSPFDFRFSMSSGVVSGKGRSPGVIRDDRGQPFGYENFIQVDAAINPGNSGGPLTDHRGRVIGMNTAIATGRGGPSGFDEGQFAGIGLAIPMDMIEPVVEQLIETGTVAKGYLGLNVADRSNVVFDELGALEFQGGGVMVTRINEDNPVRESGLRAGDVVTQFDGRSISSIQEFVRMLRDVQPGRSVQLDVWRFDDNADRGFQRTISLSGALTPGLRTIGTVQGDDSIGTVLDQIGFAGRGVRVTRLEPDGPARSAGLRRGDVITNVNGDRIHTVAQLRSEISSMFPGEDAHLEVWRPDDWGLGGQVREITVRLARLNPLRYSGVLPPDQSRQQIIELGIRRMASANRDNAREAGVAYVPGVLIVEIVEGGHNPARLEPGTIITEVMETPIGTVSEFLDALKDGDLRDPFGIRISVILPDGTATKRTLRIR